MKAENVVSVIGGVLLMAVILSLGSGHSACTEAGGEYVRGLISMKCILPVEARKI